MSRPRIGVTLDVDAGGRYQLKRDYADAVLAAGGLPVLIAHGDVAVAGAYLALCDGLVISGGAFDIAPELYGESRRDGCGPQKRERTAFEATLCEAALTARLPLLGICGGMQLLNVVRGGTLWQDLPADLGVRGHERAEAPSASTHRVEIVPGTLLASLLGAPVLEVNTSHHQAVREAGQGVLVSARAEDGVIEAIEIPDVPFALGVQWHPESAAASDTRHAAIYRGLVAAASDQRR